MDIVQSTMGFGKSVWRDVRAYGPKINHELRRSNLYRAAEYHLAAQNGVGAQSVVSCQWAIERLGDFDDHDQDKERPDWARKLQLSHVSRRLSLRLAALVDYCAKHDTDNPVLLRQLKQLSDAVVGPRANVSDARAYIRRAALKLHPDKCKDLEGWRIPNIAYSRFMPADHKYEQAKWGAEGLYAVHRSLDNLYQNPYYALALNGPAAQKGGTLQPAQAAAEYSLVSAAYFLLTPGPGVVATGILGAGAAIIAAWWLCQLAQQRRAKYDEVKCREVVLFRK